MKTRKIWLIVFILIILIAYSRDNESHEPVLSYDQEKRGIFFSYIELQNYIKADSLEAIKENIDNAISNISKMHFNLIILQVRSESDAIYESNIFPWSASISTNEGEKSLDVLAYFLKKAHKKNIEVYAWINPYRVRTNDDINSISKKNPAYKYIGTDTLFVNGGIYYNPSKQEVIDLIVNGVKEVVTNYSVDGILFDDYFYPSNDIDINDYNDYVAKNGEMAKNAYNLMKVNEMIKEVHSVCQSKKIPFGVSPEGNIENNYTKNFADVKTWLSSDLYVDFIMPQIYYGFFNETQAFPKVLQEWSNLITNNNIKLMVALAFYKVGQFDMYAKSGSNEWLTNNDIIMREIILSRNIKHYEGFCLFRYGFLFDKNLYSNTSLQEIKNIKKILK